MIAGRDAAIEIAFEQGQGRSTSCSGSPSAWACAVTRPRRTPCIATRPKDALKLVSNTRTSRSGRGAARSRSRRHPCLNSKPAQRLMGRRDSSAPALEMRHDFVSKQRQVLVHEFDLVTWGNRPVVVTFDTGRFHVIADEVYCLLR